MLLPPWGPPAGTKWDVALETQLCYEIKTFLLAGHETSAAMLTWSVFELSQSKEYMRKVGEPFRPCAPAHTSSSHSHDIASSLPYRAMCVIHDVYITPTACLSPTHHSTTGAGGGEARVWVPAA